MTSRLTTIILTHNSAEDLAALLPLVAPASAEVFVWDDNSTDQTASIARTQGVRYIRHAFGGSFAEHRNAALKKSTSDWTLFLDADERPTQELMQEIRDCMAAGTADAIQLPRQDVFLGKKLQYGETSHVQLLRVAKTKLGQGKWERAVHEVWRVPTDRVVTTHHTLEHTSHSTISGFFRKLHAYAALEPASRQPYGRLRLLGELLIYPPAKFALNFVVRQGWRDGMPGLIIAWGMAYYSLITRVILYETWHTPSSS